MTIISAVVILISTTDISGVDIVLVNINTEGFADLSQNNLALTEGVYYILLSLYKPCHGYGIMQLVDELSEGRVKLGAGTIYGALKTLLEREWIEAIESSERKKEYVITQLGQQIVEAEINRLGELFENGLKIIKG